MKKIINILLIFLMCTNVVYASTDSKEVVRIKNIFNIKNVTDFRVSNSEYYIDENIKIKTLVYEWTADGTSYNVSTDTDGNIMGYDKMDDTENNNFEIMTISEIKQAATDFINKIDSNLLKNYKLKNTKVYLKDGSAFLTYTRIVNNLEVINDTMEIEVNFHTKSVSHYNRINTSTLYKDSAFPDVKKAKNKEDVLANLETNNPFKLAYLVTGEDDNLNTVLVYTNLAQLKTVNAITGKPVQINHYNAVEDAAKASDELTDIEIAEINKIKNIKSEKDATDFISSNFDITNMQLESTHLYQDEDKNYYYTFNYNSPDGYGKFMSVNLDAKDLKLKSYMFYDDTEYKPVTLSTATAKNIANTFLSKYIHAKNIDEVNPIIVEDVYDTTVFYPRVENNIPVYSEGITILINNTSKKVTSYQTHFSKAKFNASDNLIDIAKAKETAQKLFSLKYSYMDNKPLLIYSYDEQPFIRATDGIELTSFGEEKQNLEINYSNLNSSKYKNEIQVLTELGIGFYKISDLTQELTVENFLQLMNSLYSVDLYSKQHYYYQTYEDLKEGDYSKKLTYKDAVKWTLNSMGIRKLQNAKEVWEKTIYSDYNSIEKSYLGYYFMAKANGVFDKSESLQNSSVSAEEMLHLIYQSIK